MSMVGKLFKKFFTTNISRCLGIDIGTGSLKIVELSFKQEKAVLENFAITSIPEGIIDNGIIIDTDKLKTLVQHTLAVNNFKSEYAVVSVATRNIVLREVVMPEMNIEETKKAIFWELENYVPNTPETYFFDIAYLGKAKEENMQKVLLVAAPRETVENMFAILRTIGLKLLSFNVEPIAYCKIFSNETNTMLIDIGEYFSNIIIFHEGVPLINRPIAIGGKTFTDMLVNVLESPFEDMEMLKKRKRALSEIIFSDADNSEILKQLEMLVEDLARETHRTLEYYQMQSTDILVSKAILTGGGAQMVVIPDLVTEKLQMPVNVHNSLIDIDIAPSLEYQYVFEYNLQLAVAIGLALIGGGR